MSCLETNLENLETNPSGCVPRTVGEFRTSPTQRTSQQKKFKKENNKKQFPTLLRSPFWTIITSINYSGAFEKSEWCLCYAETFFKMQKKSQRSKHFMYNLICYYIPTDWRVILLPFFLFQEKITFPTLLFLLIDVWIYDCKSQYTIHKFYLWTIKSLSLFLNHRVKCRV